MVGGFSMVVGTRRTATPLIGTGSSDGGRGGSGRQSLSGTLMALPVTRHLPGAPPYSALKSAMVETMQEYSSLWSSLPPHALPPCMSI